MNDINNYSKLIVEITKLDDPAAIMEGLGDICYDAECFYRDGEFEIALHIFSKIWELDEYSDYFAHTRRIAKEFLEKLDYIRVPTNDEIMGNLKEKYKHLPEDQVYLIIAKHLYRECAKRDGAIKCAIDALNHSEKIKPLSKKDLRFKVELHEKLR